MIERLIELKEKFESKNPRWIFKMEDYTEDIRIMDKAVYLIIRGENEVDKQKTIDFTFLYCRGRVKDNFLTFRKEVKDFKKFVQEIIDDYDFRSLSWNISYGADSDKESIRIAEINVTFDITKVRDALNYELMEKLYINGGNNAG